MTGTSPDNPAFGEPEDRGSDDDLRQQLASAVRYWRMPVKDIWLRYFSLGGSVGEYELDAYINSSYTISPLQHDILAQAINELIDARPEPPRAPYSSDALDRSDGPSKARNDQSPGTESVDDDPRADEY